MAKVHITRVAVLITLFTTGILGIFAMPMDDSPSWYSDLLLSKAIGAGGIWTFHRLYKKWRMTDKWIKAYDKWAAAHC